MKASHEVLKQTIARRGAKAVASDLNLSPSMIYKWCQPNDGPDSSGAGNPLDRLLEICRITDDDAPINWLCQQSDSFRVKNMPVTGAACGGVLDNTQSILKEFSDVLEAVTDSYAHGQRIDQQEADRIRKEWEELKSVTEQFVHACEQGRFDPSTQQEGA
jgi:hypothetical protein